MVLWRKKAPPKPKEEVPAPAAPIELVAAAPGGRGAPPTARRLPGVAGDREPQFLRRGRRGSIGGVRGGESLVREAPMAASTSAGGPVDGAVRASEATTARAPSRESSPRDAGRGTHVSFDERRRGTVPSRGGRAPVTAEAVSRALRRARGGHVDDADDDTGASDDEDADPVAAPPGEETNIRQETNVRPPDPAQRIRLVEWRFLVRRAMLFSAGTRPSRNDGRGPRRPDRRRRSAPTFAVARRPATAGPRRRRRSEDALACLRAPLDLSLCDFLDDLVNLCDAAEAAEKRRTS